MYLTNNLIVKMDVLKTFLFENSKHDVEIQFREEKPMFRADQIGRVIGIKNVRDAVKNFDSDEKGVEKSDMSQNCIFLTEMGVYRLLMRSNKPLAKPFQKWVANVIQSIRETGEYKLQEEIDKNNTEHKSILKKYQLDQEAHVHKTLVDSSVNKGLVYIGKIKDMDDGKMLVKIGSTIDMRQRVSGLRVDYGSFNLMRLFECRDCYPFEKFVHQHVNIKRYIYKEPMKNGKISNEVYLMSQSEIDRAILIISRNVVSFRRDTETIVDVEDRFKQLEENLRKEFSGMKRSFDEIEPIKSKRGNYTTGFKIQMYTIHGNLVSTFNQITDVCREIEGSKRDAVIKAYSDDIEYMNHRWMTLDRNLPDETEQKLNPVVFHKPIRTGIVVEISKKDGSIQRVYENFKIAGRENKYKSDGAVQKIMKYDRELNGNRVMSWSDCSEEVQDDYLKNHNLPELKKCNGKHLTVFKLDKNTGEIIKKYNTMEEAVRKCKIARRSFKSAVAKGTEYRGFKWRIE